MATLSENVEAAINCINQYRSVISRTATEVVLPDGISAVGSNLFNSCKSLTGVVVPQGCVMLAGAAFASCTNLRTIYIPASVTSINNNCFLNCSSLENVYFAGTRQQWSAVSMGTNNDNLLNANITFNTPYHTEQ